MVPRLAQALVSAATPPADFESVLGDLCEEYAQRRDAMGVRAADRWYWSQAIRSLPFLLSYSRDRSSFVSTLVTCAAVLLGLLAMLVCNELIDDALMLAVPQLGNLGGWHVVPFFIVGWLLAAAFGGLIAMALRSRALRAPLAAALGFLALIAVPIALGFSSQLSVTTWILVIGAVPAMIVGAALLRIVSRR